MKKNKVYKGYIEYFEKSINNNADGDPKVSQSFKEDGIWYLYRSFEAFESEMNYKEKGTNSIPRKKLVVDHWKKYPNIG
ncbi:hypothetical protein [Methanosalsum natronophilum]|uniref:Uncharacterized protein n=1 Tax=Methanosalsum natronophilum TaxID=768733 RepID=A0A3R7VSM0_9EURY|nr:hypothetical protein [Methanosalsum natronophilum]MCS3924284.1 hypothetical protein [Methanosalsum natronophilum]RQD82387.1 MAG: hypothetical protein D5R95_07270 [Methanosalsum natronophilum]